MSDRPSTSGALPTRLHGSIVTLSPTTAWRWRRCRRLYLLRNVAQLPGLQAGPAAAEGSRIHAVLHQLHAGGSCHDPAHVEETVALYALGDDERLRGYLTRHAERCPQGANYLGGEVPLARFHRDPAPLFTASGSIDAIWIHDGILDARDYKTGAATGEDLRGDVRAQVQAWLLAPLAASRKLRLRLRYEFLSPESTEDPDGWEPDGGELDAIEETLRSMVEEIRAEREFVGVGRPAICGGCEYRTICIDAQTEDPTPPAAPRKGRP